MALVRALSGVCILKELPRVGGILKIQSKDIELNIWGYNLFNYIRWEPSEMHSFNPTPCLVCPTLPRTLALENSMVRAERCGLESLVHCKPHQLSWFVEEEKSKVDDQLCKTCLRTAPHPSETVTLPFGTL